MGRSLGSSAAVKFGPSGTLERINALENTRAAMLERIDALEGALARVAAVDRNDPKSGLASLDQIANLSGPVFGCIEDTFCNQTCFFFRRIFRGLGDLHTSSRCASNFRTAFSS